MVEKNRMELNYDVQDCLNWRNRFLEWSCIYLIKSLWCVWIPCTSAETFMDSIHFDEEDCLKTHIARVWKDLCIQFMVMHVSLIWFIVMQKIVRTRCMSLKDSLWSWRLSEFISRVPNIHWFDLLWYRRLCESVSRVPKASLIRFIVFVEIDWIYSCVRLHSFIARVPR